MEKNLCMRPEFFSFSKGPYCEEPFVGEQDPGSRCGLVVRSEGEQCARIDYKVTLPVRLTLARSLPCVRSCVLRARAIVRDTRASARSRVPRSPPLRAVGSGVCSRWSTLA